MTNVASGEQAGVDSASLSAAEQAVTEDLLGRRSRKGALRRGFKILPRVLPYLRPYRKLAIPSVILTILLAVAALAEPWPLAFVVDSVIGHKRPPGWVSGIFGSGVGALIALAVVATLFLTLLSGLMTVWNEYLTTSIDQRMVLDFRSDMFKHAQRLSLAYHDRESKGILMYRINSQASGMGQLVTDLPAVAQDVLTVFGMAYIATRINPLLALLALGTTPFVVYSTTYYTKRIEPRLYRVRGLGAFTLAIVYESMSMLRVVLAFGTQRKEFKRFREVGEDFVDQTVGLAVRQTVFKLAVQTIAAAGTAAVLGVGAYQAVNGKITAGELLVILFYINQIYTPLENLTNTITNFQQEFINLLMAFELLDTEPDITEKPGALPLERARGEIELDGVEFHYEGRPEVLKDVSLRIPPGRAVAVVGPTGAGKSTLASLLPRFYDPAEGSVRLDGHDVRDLKLADLRSKFSIVLQEPLLFSGTLATNIKYGKDDATPEEVIEAAKAANAHEFISALPDGYNTLLGEGGSTISGGERQRIAVARAFLRDAPVLILDEPTSAIDSRTESVILDALDRLMEGRTTIIIAHRLSTLRSVDEILVMDHGEIVQRGPHEELVGQPGLYRQLWEAQTRAGDGRPSLPPPAIDEEPRQATVDEEPQQAAVDEERRQPAVDEEPRQPARAAVARLDAPKVEADEHEVAPAAPPPSPEGEAKPSAGRRPVPGPSTVLPRPKIVLLGMLTKIPVGGVAWLVGHYAVGFERLGYEVYYVEAHARTPSMFMTHEEDDGAGKAAAYIARTAERFGLEDRWAFQALHENGRCYGMSSAQLDRLYRDAALIVNMHGGTLPLPEHAATDRLVFLGTDPVEVELEVQRGDKRALEFLDQHVAYFTWGLNYGNPDCELPWARPYSFVPSPPPVVLDFWHNAVDPSGPFTTVGNWRQQYRDVHYGDRVYRWSKHQQFMKILDLPMRTQAQFELALSSYDGRDRLLLAEHGWRVRPALDFSRGLDTYRDYIIGSAGEVSAAKEQNVHFRTGWFSERSATYLAAGRPVIVQDTGFGAAIPTGEGLFAFANLDEAVEAVTAVQADPARHRRAASDLAREYLSHEVVLGDMLDHVGLRPRAGRRPSRKSPAPVQLPEELALDGDPGNAAEPGEETRQYILGRPVPAAPAPSAPPVVTVVVPVLGDLARARLAIEAVLANTREPAFEVVAVDNGSSEPTRDYLDVLAARNRHVRVIRNKRDIGFAAACNRGIATGKGEIFALLGDGVIVTPDWLSDFAAHLEDPAIGLVGAVANLSGDGAQPTTSYETYGEMVQFAQRRRQELDAEVARDVDVLDMSWVVLRRDVLEVAGLLDEDLEIGALASDYARRVRDAGRRVVCALDVFGHRFAASPEGLQEEAAPVEASEPDEAEFRPEEEGRTA
ncbi:MAG: ATP-binding cassette domain-containing protein [Actinomycetota bacterium]